MTQNVVLTSAYDYNGNRTSLTANIGGTLYANGTVSGGTADFINTYTYDTLGNMTSIVQTGSQTAATAWPRKTSHLGYDVDSRLTQIDRYSATNAASANSGNEVATSNYTYNARLAVDGPYLHGAGQHRWRTITGTTTTTAR